MGSFAPTQIRFAQPSPFSKPLFPAATTTLSTPTMAANKKEEVNGLAEPAMLEKIDKLFACGVGELVDLPQIVVVGDQSSGKSSVLEGLVNKPLPRDSGLCTRFATQIVFRREASEGIVVSIIPDQHASPEHTARVRAYKKDVESLDSAVFTEIMKEVHTEMGLSKTGEDGKRTPTFSNDILRLEVSGPDQEHLSVVDVPGIFKSTTEGLTTKADIELVRNMVHGYMINPRSVMLAVIPAHVDVATQEILELALEADPAGDRTLGVLTKPDLVDKGAESHVVNLMDGRSRSMKLGWHMIVNPGQKELSDTELDRTSLEDSFFRSTSPWNLIDKDKVGINSLRLRLKEILSGQVKKVFPKVKQEIKTRLNAQQKKLKNLGPERGELFEQNSFLTELATNFQRLVTLALTANYAADTVFNSNETLRIAPAVRFRQDTFADEMAKFGQTYSFLRKDGEDAVPPPPDEETEFNVRKEADIDELADVLHKQISLLRREAGDIKPWLHEKFLQNRGFEIGTFNPSIIATTMRKQSEKWEDISLGYVSDIIVMVQMFIESALASLCSDRDVRVALLNKMSDKLNTRYGMAMTNTKFLLQVERSNTPATQNHCFNNNLQKSRQGKVMASMRKNAFPLSRFNQNSVFGSPDSMTQEVVPVSQAVAAHDMSNDDFIVQDIHDILKSYYKVARKTFVDSVCKQAVNHHLLHGEESPLMLFSPIYVSRLKKEELREIAGEAPGLQRMRAQLKKEIESLKDAMKILNKV
ncbi:Interferon-induced GTP-binding protein Mx1 [Fulvia fulva]|nr:Interferon-induced GTP-binding protein Mx1 [Fulvia fulva]KAK4611430.1 Interferon-induced GTP-binding protein Mx1 [Fulvia fulva]